MASKRRRQQWKEEQQQRRRAKRSLWTRVTRLERGVDALLQEYHRARQDGKADARFPGLHPKGATFLATARHLLMQARGEL